MNKPVWLLDVDGVINAWPAGQSNVWDDYRTVSVVCNNYPYPICYSPSVVSFINDIHVGGLAEVRWLTTWGNEAQQELSRMLGFDHFEVQARPSFNPLWKLNAALGVAVDEGRRLAWTDDDISSYYLEGVRSHENDFADSLILSPCTSVGLAPEHLTHLIRYFAN